MDRFRLLPLPGYSPANYDLDIYDGKVPYEYVGKTASSIGQDIHSFYLNENKFEKIYFASSGDALAFKGTDIENKSNPEYSLFQVYLNYSSDNRSYGYFGSDLNEFIWAPDIGSSHLSTGMGWVSTIDNRKENQNILVGGGGGKDIFYMPLNSIEVDIAINSLGLTKVSTLSNTYWLADIEIIEFLDGNKFDLDALLNSFDSANSFSYSLSEGRNLLKASLNNGPGIPSEINNYDNLVLDQFGDMQAPGLIDIDFYKGNDILIVPFSSSDYKIINTESGITFSTDIYQGFYPKHKNLEIIQFSDVAYKFDADHGYQEVNWNSLETSTSEPTPTPTPIPIPTPSPTPSPTPTPDTAAPNLLFATLRGDELTLQFDDVLSDTLPKLRNFTLKKASREVEFQDAEVFPSSGYVILKVKSAIDSTANVTLDYFDLASDQTTGVIQSKTGVDLASFSGFQINNQTTQENNLAIDDADFEGNTINLYLNAPIGSAVPSAKRFKVKAGRKSQKIVGINTDPSEGVITLTTQKPVGSYESLKVSYKDLGGDQSTAVIEDKSGNDMKTIRDYEIINGGFDETPPKLVSAELDDNILTMEFDSIISNTKLSKSRFKVKANGKKLKVKSAAVEDNDESFVNLVVQTKRNQVIDLQSEVTLSYSDPKGDQSKQVIEDLFGNDLLSVNSFFVDIV